MIATDVDGVLTDGRIWIGSDGEAFKSFDAKDGMGIKIAQTAGIAFAIITGRKSKIVERRAEELGVTEVYQGVKDKWLVLCQLMDKYGLDASEVAYVGDDLNDLAIIRAVGFGVSVADGVPEIRRCAAYVTCQRGGRGAVREVIEVVLKAQGKWQEIVERFS